MPLNIKLISTKDISGRIYGSFNKPAKDVNVKFGFDMNHICGYVEGRRDRIILSNNYSCVTYANGIFQIRNIPKLYHVYCIIDDERYLPYTERVFGNKTILHIKDLC